MEIHIGNRKAFYCNVKAMLLLLVIYGHLIENRIDDSVILLWQYRLIYAVHMPLFALVSGMFLKTKEACIAQTKLVLKYYMLCQTVFVVVTLVRGNEKASIFIPYWHLWYLLSLFFWAIVCMVAGKIKRNWIRILLIFISIVLGCACGYVEGIGRFLSLSRTICFLPFVLLGQILPVDMVFSHYKMESSMVGVISLGLLVLIAPMMPVGFFYYATSYEASQIIFGVVFRLISYLIAFGLGFFLLSIIPAKRLIFSKAGVDTFGIYLLHGPVVKLLREIEMSMELFVPLAPVLAVLVYFMLFELCRWKGKYCGII